MDHALWQCYKPLKQGFVLKFSPGEEQEENINLILPLSDQSKPQSLVSYLTLICLLISL